MKEILITIFLLNALISQGQTFITGKVEARSINFISDKSFVFIVQDSIIRNSKTHLDSNNKFSIEVKMNIDSFRLLIEYKGCGNYVTNKFMIEAEKTNDLGIIKLNIDAKSNKCPIDQSDKIISILYGKPTRESINKEKKGALKLGGCVIFDCHPKWFCPRHEVEFK